MVANQVQPLPSWPDDLHDEAGAEQAVGFHTQIAYCRESDGEATVYLLRTGPAAGVAEVDIAVGTAKHTWGHKIASRTTKARFEHGERIIPLVVPLEQGDSWDLMNEVHLEIKMVRGEGGGEAAGSPRAAAALAGIGEKADCVEPAPGSFAIMRQGRTMKIKAIDDDYWPSNKVVKQAAAGESKTTQPLGAGARVVMQTSSSDGFVLLVKEFVRERWRSRGWKPRYTSYFIILQAFWHVFQLYLYKIIIDNCIKGENITLLIIICVGMMVMEAMMWWAEYRIVDYRGNTGTRRDLRNWMIRKWMMLSPQQHTFIGAHRFYVAATEDVNLAVVGCWWGSFRMQYFCWWLLFAVVALSVLYPPALGILLGTLLVAFAVVMHRKGTYHDHVLKQRKADECWQDNLGNVIETTDLIQSCHTRHRAANVFKGIYDDFYKKHRAANFFAINVKWTSVLVINAGLVIAIYVGAHLVINGHMEIGVFTAVLTIIKGFSKQAVKAVEVVVGMLKGAVSLSRVSKFLNLPEHYEGTQELHHLSIYSEAIRRTRQDLAARGHAGFRARKKFRRGSFNASSAVRPDPGKAEAEAEREAEWEVERREPRVSETVDLAMRIHRQSSLEIEQLAEYEERSTLQPDDPPAADGGVKEAVGEELGMVGAAASGRVIDIGIDGKGLHHRLCDALDSPVSREMLEKHLVDHSRIVVHGVSFRYYARVQFPTPGLHSAPSGRATRWIFRDMSMELAVGKIYEVAAESTGDGPAHSGKETFLRLLSGALQPTEGDIAWPPHFKLSTIPRQPLLVTGTLEENLTYAMYDKDIVSRRQLKQLCHVIDIEPCLLENDLQLYIDEHGFNLCTADRRKITIIRSLLSDPDVLLVSQVEDAFRAEELGKVLQLLKLWRDKSGLLGITQPHQWRTRTIIMTGDRTRVTQAHANFVDDIIELPHPEPNTWAPAPSHEEWRQIFSSITKSSGAVDAFALHATDIDYIDAIAGPP